MRSITVSPSATSAGDDQARRGAQVGRHHGRARQLRDALDDRDAAVDLDLRAQAQQLVDVHEAVLEDRLGDRRRAVGDAVERHELRLHVGRKRRVFAGAQADRAQPGRRRARGSSRRRCRSSRRPRAASRSPRRGGRRGRGAAPTSPPAAATAHRKVPASMRSATMRCGDAVQPLDADDADPARAVALDARAHRDQHLGEVGRPRAPAPRSRARSRRRPASPPSAGSRCR